MRIHADPDPDPQSWSEPVLCGWIRCEDVKAKTVFLLLFSLFLYEKEPEPVKKKYLELVYRYFPSTYYR